MSRSIRPWLSSHAVAWAVGKKSPRAIYTASVDLSAFRRRLSEAFTIDALLGLHLGAPVVALERHYSATVLDDYSTDYSWMAPNNAVHHADGPLNHPCSRLQCCFTTC